MASCHVKRQTGVCGPCFDPFNTPSVPHQRISVNLVQHHSHQTYVYWQGSLHFQQKLMAKPQEEFKNKGNYLVSGLQVSANNLNIMQN